ncbi:unnamed protein product [Brassicogethes aeneus]|uniref:DUF4806 domain-containing protein n=1 Tax=Brassicogethes aeneus TaxID=1431903 RepID=A0A9P0AV92_BRAAE|nr:unnamed protein product [Brassicogethes aeneus]
MIRNVEEGLLQLEKKITELENLLKKRKPSNSVTKAINGFPLTTVEEFEDMEKDDKVENCLEMASRLTILGAADLRSFVALAIKEIMVDALVVKFSWCGLRGNKMFNRTKLCALIFEAAMDCTRFNGPSDMSEFKEHVDEVFRTTKQRYLAQQKNQRKTQESPGTNSTGAQEMLEEEASSTDESFKNSDLDESCEDSSTFGESQ